MARVSPPVTVLLSLLFFFTLSFARDVQNTFSEPKPDSEPQTHHPEPKTVSFTIDTIDPIPLTLLRFRPINRHIQPGLSLRNGNRRCRHGHRREIPYGNDAILLGDASAARRIHPRWVRVHSSADMRLPATEERKNFRATEEGQDSDREQHHHGERHHHHHHGEKSWFTKKIRKFLNLF